MNATRIFVTTATALSVLAAIGCTSTQKAPEVATAPVVVPAPAPEPVAVDAMPSHPALQNERTAEAAPASDAPVVVAEAPVAAPAPTVVAQAPVAAPTPSADFIERAPKADRN